MQSITPEDAGGFGNARVDPLVAAAFIEVLHLIKHVIFDIEQGLCNLVSSEKVPFRDILNEAGSSMRPIILNVLVTSKKALHNTVVSPGQGAHTKFMRKDRNFRRHCIV